jgi:hypothetical protein
MCAADLSGRRRLRPPDKQICRFEVRYPPRVVIDPSTPRPEQGARRRPTRTSSRSPRHESAESDLGLGTIVTTSC